MINKHLSESDKELYIRTGYRFRIIKCASLRPLSKHLLKLSVPGGVCSPLWKTDHLHYVIVAQLLQPISLHVIESCPITMVRSIF